MPDATRIVINTGPILALIAALGDLEVLKSLYKEVHVPVEVGREILVGGTLEFGVQQFMDASWLNKWKIQQAIPPFLDNTLDQGEAAVIQLALSEKIRTVCIDESVGRRVARLNGLLLTGSVGILLRAKREGLMSSVGKPLQRMQKNGIWLSDRVVSFALRQSGESEQE